MTPSWKIARCSLQFFAVFAFFLEDPLLPISFGSSDRQHLLVNLLESSEGLRGRSRGGGRGSEEEWGGGSEGVRRSGKGGGGSEGVRSGEGGGGSEGVRRSGKECLI